MRGADKTALNRLVNRDISPFRDVDVERRNLPADPIANERKVRAAEFALRFADQIKGVSGFLQVHRNGLGDVVHLPHRADEQGRRNRDRLFAFRTELVVQRVFTANERRTERDRNVATRKRGANQRAENFRFVGVPPTEVVEDRNRRRVGADRDGVARRFVDGGGGHPVGVVVAVVRVHPVRDDQTAAARQARTQDGGVARAVAFDADERFQDASALNFVVVLANRPVFARDVQRAENRFQVERRRGFAAFFTAARASDRLRNGGLAREFDAFRFDRNRFDRRDFVNGLADHRRATVVHEGHRQVGDRNAVVFQDETAGRLKFAQNDRFDVFAFGQRFQFRPFVFRNREDHPLLRFADPHFGVRKAFVFERNRVKVDFGADFFAHFADRAREAARAAVGDGVVKAAVARFEHHVENFLFFDRVPDLHRAAGERFAFARQFRAAKGGAVNPVAPGATAHRDDQVADFRLFERLVDRNQADVAAVNQRVAEVAFVEEDRAVDGRDAHSVAVVADAGDDAFNDAARVKDAVRQLVRVELRRREAENIGVADRFRAEAGAHRVADDAADSGVGAAVRLERARVVVRFDFEADVVFVVELDDARVVGENADAEVVGAEVFADFDGRAEDRFLQHILEEDFAFRAAVRNPPGERFMAAVFAPSLRDRFEFDVGRVAVEVLEMLPDRLHFDERQVELASLAERFEFRVVHRANRDRLKFEIVRRTDLERVETEFVERDLLDRVVGEEFTG